MSTVYISIPDEVLFDAGMTLSDATDLARQMTAVGLYAGWGVSLDHCAEIAHMPKADFIMLLGRFGMSMFHYDDESDLDEELANSQYVGWFPPRRQTSPLATSGDMVCRGTCAAKSSSRRR